MLPTASGLMFFQNIHINFQDHVVSQPRTQNLDTHSDENLKTFTCVTYTNNASV